jgi:hypothetical protein
MPNDSNPPPDLELRPAPQKSPHAAEYFLVRCPGFRCLAYKDPEGNWRNAHDTSLLPEVLEVLSEP